MRTIKAWTRIAVISSAVLVLVACGGGGGSSYSGGGTNVTVPTVTGMTQAAATSAITGAGLTLGTVTMASSNSVASGNVISQNPAAGASVASGSAVALTVSSGPAPVAVPNVVGQTQAAATTAITGAGLKVGTVTMANSNSVAAGNVISESPAAGSNVAPGSSVNLTVSTGAAGVAVPNVVGDTQIAASTAITTAGLKVGTVTMQSSDSVAAGDVISESPAAGTQVAAGSAVNLAVSSGPPKPHYAYVANQGDHTLSEFSLDPSTGALTAVAGSPLTVTGTPTPKLNEIKIDPTGKFVYVADQGGADVVFGYQIQADGSLMAITGSPFGTGVKPVSLAFDATGAYLYVLNANNSNISQYSVNSSTGALTPLSPATAKINAGGSPGPAQIVRSGSYIYVALTNVNGVDLFTIGADGTLTETSDGNAPYPTDTGPYGLAVNPAGTLLYTANNGPSGAGSVSSFMITGAGSPTPGSLAGFCTPVPPATICHNALPITAASDIGIDPQGKYLFVTDQTNKGAGLLDVFPLDASAATGLDSAVSGSPFSTGGNGPNAVSFDASGTWVFVPNSGSANLAEFSLNSTTGALTPVAASPIAAGNTPVFIAAD